MPSVLEVRLEKEFNSFVLHHNPGHFDPLIELLKNTYDLTGKRILEFGCGTGDFLIALSTSQAKYLVGVDISQTSITVARNKLPPGNAAIQFECVNILQDSRYDGAQDAIVSHSVIQYMTDLDIVFKRFFETLTTQGIIFITLLQRAALPISIFQWFGLYCLPRSLKERFHLIFRIPWVGKKILGGQSIGKVIESESRYLGIPVVQNQTPESLEAKLRLAGFVDIVISDAPRFSKISAPYLLIKARKP